MFWRFGFHSTSTIDSLLDKEDVSVEAILDEDDLLQECKAQNTRLIDYFQRVDVLQRLLGYVTGRIEIEENGQFKYPHTATEVLCSEIWSIVETCVNEQAKLLVPFWDTVLDRSAQEMKLQMTMASRFARVNAVFMQKKPLEMLAFIQDQPSVVERLLRHIENPSFMDLLVRIIQLDDVPGNSGVLEWLSSQKLMPRLLDHLSPTYPPDVHQVASELIKGIISLATPSPSDAAGLVQNAPASNRFARELASRESVLKLSGYILHDFGPLSEPESESELQISPISPTYPSHPTFSSYTSSAINSMTILIELIRKNNSDYFEPYLFHTLRNRLIQVQQGVFPHYGSGGEEEGGREKETLEKAMGEMVERMGVVNLGNVLEVVCEDGGLEKLVGFLREPRSSTNPHLTSLGLQKPLTFERFRICELFAELLHCSNMSLLNRPAEYNRLYDDEGRLRGGLEALAELANVIQMGREGGAGGGGGSSSEETETGVETETETGEGLTFPVHRTLAPPSTSSIGSGSVDFDQDMTSSDDDDDDEDGDTEPTSSDDEAMEMEEIVFDDGPSPSLSSASLSPIPPITPENLSTTTVLNGSGSRPPSSTNQNQNQPNTNKSKRSSKRYSTPDPLAQTTTQNSTGSAGGTGTAAAGGGPGGVGGAGGGDLRNMVIGERLKMCMLRAGVLGTLLDLFSEFPWNNFLHSAVYDFIHQILTGNIDAAPTSSSSSSSLSVSDSAGIGAGGSNRELAISLFRDAKLLHRIVEMQRVNDVESAKPKGLRQGYMGHLTLISEDVLIALDVRFPPDLRNLILTQYTPQPDWDEYVSGRYNETKKRDTSLLGGGKPVRPPGGGFGAAGGVPGGAGGGTGGAAGRWKVDEEDRVAGVGGGGGGPSPISPSASASMGVTTTIPDVIRESIVVGGGGAGAGFGGSTTTTNGIGLKGEFKRASSGHPSRASSADFGPGASMDEDDDEDVDIDEDDEDEIDATPQFTRYLAHATMGGGLDDDDDDDDDAGWLSRAPFSSAQQASSGTTTTMARSSGFGDAFDPSSRPPSNSMRNIEDPFASDDDFGPFSSDSSISMSSSASSTSTTTTDPLTFSTGFSDDMDDSESFGDFGEFHGGGGDGSSTPTADSWSFGDGSSGDDHEHEPPDSPYEDKRMQLESTPKAKRP